MLQANAYAGFSALSVDGTIQEAPCWAHARSKFYDLHMARPSAITTEAPRRIAELYGIENEIRGKPPHERQLVHQQRARPLLDDFGNWLRATLEKPSRKSDTAAAFQYALNLWRALLRYCDDGMIEIDNSAAEGALRGVAIGRRNLTASADSGGERTVTIYSLIGTGARHGVDPEASLRHVLADIAEHPFNRVDDFLPCNWPAQFPRLKEHAASQRCDAIINQFSPRLKTALAFYPRNSPIDYIDERRQYGSLPLLSKR